MPTNQIIPFCPVDTGTNLLTQSDYNADSDRVDGNQPGVARSKLNNKALRQSSYMASQLAQYMANKTGNDILDDAIPAKLLAIMNAAFMPIAPEVTSYASSAGNHLMNYKIFCIAANATVGATYSNNSQTFTVKKTIAGGLYLEVIGGGDPSFSGTLTKTSGTGDATIQFYSFRKPLYYLTKLVGAGGGGSGSGETPGGAGSAGGDTTFGGMTAGGGLGGVWQGNPGGLGGTPTIGAFIGIALQGQTAMGYRGTGGAGGFIDTGSRGGDAPFFGGGAPGSSSNVVPNAASAPGGGGAGAGMQGGGNDYSGSGGGSGAYIEATIANPLSSYAYSIGTKGTGGTAGGGVNPGAAGGDAADGMVIVFECYQ